jgi:hypothetical protein
VPCRAVPCRAVLCCAVRVQDNIPYTITMVPVIEYLASAGLGLDIKVCECVLRVQVNVQGRQDNHVRVCVVGGGEDEGCTPEVSLTRRPVRQPVGPRVKAFSTKARVWECSTVSILCSLHPIECDCRQHTEAGYFMCAILQTPVSQSHSCVYVCFMLMVVL